MKLTETHEQDIEIIYQSGLLRYNTERVGTLLLMERPLQVAPQAPEEPPPQGEAQTPAHERRLSSEVFRELDAICNGLLGQGRAGDGGPPRAQDAGVREAVRHWMHEYLERLRALSADFSHANESKVAEAIDLVNGAAQAVETIVDEAMHASDIRFQKLRTISVVRFIMGLVWTLLFAHTFGNLWQPYMMAFSRYEKASPEPNAILRASFHAVVAIKITEPFHVISSTHRFDQLLGQPMTGKSIFSCARGPMEQLKLAEKLTQARRAEERQYSWRSAINSFFTWSLLPEKPMDNFPVVDRFTTSWWSGPLSQQSMKLEVLVASRPYSHRTRNTAFLAVRKLDADDNGTQPSAASTATATTTNFQIVLQEHAESSSAHSSGTVLNLMPGVAVGSLTPRSEIEDTPPSSIAHGMPVRTPGFGWPVSPDLTRDMMERMENVLRGRQDPHDPQDPEDS